MDAIISYIPMDRRQALAQGTMLPQQTEGAALFADISGFTPLTAVLAQELGPRRGAEELIRQINLIYDALIAEVHRYRGSVLYFSGDSITCWFDDNDELGIKNYEAAVASSPIIHHSALQAVACALAMQARIQAFATIETRVGKRITLAIKVAVAAGPARRFLLGDPQVRRIDGLAGAVLERVAAAERLAYQGEVVVSDEVVQQNPTAFQVAEWRTTATHRCAIVTGLNQPVPANPWPPLSIASQLTEEVARTWLLPPVYDKLKMGTAHYLAELRTVVSLFLRFTGLDYDQDETAAARLDAFIQWVQRVVARYEGYVLELTLGDKGSYLYAAFGAPRAHEDDSDRAMQAALALRALPPEFSFIQGLQIGLSRGQMRVGPYGSQTRRTYGVVGFETNMAARLMSQAAPGQILASQRVVDSLVKRPAIELNYIGPLAVKGSEQLIPVYEVIGRAGRQGGTAVSRLSQTHIPHTPQPMIGREAEQRYLVAQLQALQAGESRILLIEGEAGIGKSRLVEELRQQAQQAGITCLVGEGSAIEQASPYHAWRAIFSTLFQLETQPDNLEMEQERVLSQLPADIGAAELAPLLNAVLPFDWPENELTCEMTGLARATKTQALLTAVLQQSATHSPLLLILEDADWLDSASWALAQEVSQTVHPLLLVIVARSLTAVADKADDLGHSPYHALLADPAVRRLRLEPLPADDAITLVCRRLGVPTLPEPVAVFIREQAEGHPFFSEELGYALRDTGLIQIVDGRCRLAPGVSDLRQFNFPTTIEGVITSRIDRLAPAQQLTLKVASIIGRIFALSILRAIYPIENERPNLLQHLEVLDRLDITPLETAEPDLAYIFKHLITQEVAYNLMLSSQQCDLHRGAAEWYEQNRADELPQFYALLAHHWQKARVMDKAIDYLEKAGEEALRQFANAEAIRFFSTALSLVAEPAEQGAAQVPLLRQARWHRQLGEAHYGLGRPRKSQQQFRQTVAMLGYPMPTVPRRLAVGLLSQALRQMWQRLRPVQRRAIGADDAARFLEAARAYQGLSHIHYIFNDTVPLLYTTLRSLNLAEKIEPTPELAENYATLCVVSGLIPVHRWAESYTRLAQETAELLEHTSARAYVLTRVAIYQGGIGQWEKGVDGAREGADIYCRLGDRRNQGDALTTLSHIRYFANQFQASIEDCTANYEVGVAGENRQHQAWGVMNRARALLRLGCLAEAEIDLNLARQLLGESIVSGEEIMIGGVQALVYLYQGRPAEALSLAEAIFKPVTKDAVTIFAALEGYAGVAEVYLAAWEQGRIAQKPAQQAVRAMRRFARVFPIGRPRYWLYQGQYEWQRGRPSQAHKAWQTSLTWAQRLAMPFEAGLAHEAIGRHLTADDPRRAEQLAQAATVFTTIGAVSPSAMIR